MIDAGPRIGVIDDLLESRLILHEVSVKTRSGNIATEGVKGRTRSYQRS